MIMLQFLSVKPTGSSKITVNVALTRIIFAKLSRFEVTEDAAFGTIVGVVLAEDIDSGVFGQVVYSLAGLANAIDR